MLNFKCRTLIGGLFLCGEFIAGLSSFSNKNPRSLIRFHSTRLFVRSLPTRAHYLKFWTRPMKGRRAHYNIAKNTYKRGEGGFVKGEFSHLFKFNFPSSHVPRGQDQIVEFRR